MKKIFILSLVFSFIAVAVSAQENRGELNRRYRTEQGFNRRPADRSQRFRMEGRNRFRQGMAQRRLHRYAFDHRRGERRMMARNHFNRGRMMRRQHFYKGRRVI